MQEALFDTYGYQMNAYKPATQTVISSVALVNDDSLFLQLCAGVHEIVGYIPIAIAAAANNIRYQFVADQGLTINSISLQGALKITAVADQLDATTALAQVKTGGVANAWTLLQISGSINVQNPGVLQFQFAQNVSGATNTQVLAGAYMQSFNIAVTA